ncbi:amino acid permease [Xanthobacteraceae bacterium Astr-EGSB]|uniref:APC family permease n=1 Tax=Astrobacterium formosum TaxID=3069710 RepID=UPI0027B7CC34|nr:amino acid permease [Xanthobacteraceae bacterium Astr-EGSB]
MNAAARAAPHTSLSVLDGIAIIVGVVVGIGLFKAPSLVAANTGSEWAFIGLWIAGGLITLAGALVYAELATLHPGAGGEYTFLSRGIGRTVALLFAWGRISVIQTGALAAVAFVFGDYAQAIVPLGPSGPAVYAVMVLAVMTLINLRGTRQGKITQNLLSGLTFMVILMILAAAFVAAEPATPPPARESSDGGGSLGLAMVFVLLTYGGWNEVAYVSGEFRDRRRGAMRVLVLGTLTIMILYLLTNLAYLAVLGLEGVRQSPAVAADVIRAVAGDAASVALSIAVCIAALSTLNASILTGARVYFALGSDLRGFGSLGAWDESGNNPRRAILVQSSVAMGLILFGAMQRDGFQTMVEYTAPVFWLFMLLVGVSYFRLRRDDVRPLLLARPLHPVVPLLFCAACAYLVYASVLHAGLGALAGLGVLLVGLPLILILRRRDEMIAAE